MTADVGAEQMIPLARASEAEAWSFACGLRGGMVVPFTASGWHLDNNAKTTVHGPDADVIGGRVLLTVGFGVYGWQPELR